MRHPNLVAISLSSILVGTTSAAYAAQGQPADPNTQAQGQPQAPLPEVPPLQQGSKSAPNVTPSDTRADQDRPADHDRDQKKDYTEAQRDQADIQRDKADIHADRNDIAKDRADIRADRGDIRSDHQDLRADHSDFRNGASNRQSDDMKHSDTATKDGRTLTAMNRAHSTSDRSLHSDATHPRDLRTQGVTAQTLANNTLEQNQKQQPSKDNVKKAWYHFW